MRSQMRVAGCIALLSASTAHVAPVLAAEQASQSMAFYAIATALDGTFVIGDVTANLNLSASEVFDHLDWAAMGGYRYQTESWSTQVDVIYASLTGEKTGSGGVARTKVDLNQTMIEIDGGYRFNENLELLVGLRYWDFENEIQLFLSNATRQATSDENWIDPLIGARLTLPIGSNWEFVARGDIGGFGIGSDFAWQATAYFNWKVGETFGVLFGYRIFDVDFEEGSGSNRSGIDLQQSGPAIGVAISF